MLDTARHIETPEGIELALQVAGPVPRALAWMIDIGIRVIVYIAMLILIRDLGDFGKGVFLLAMFLLEWFYPVAFEIFMGGATPGKRLLRLRVVSDDGAPVQWSASTIRNLMRFVDFAPMGYATGLVCMMLHAESKRLGDLAAGTIVVYVARPEPQRVETSAQARPPPWPLLPTEQRTIVDFAERLPRITQARADELALSAGSLVSDAQDPTAQLQSYAAWISGER
jgi:uncharacterized RDD family membrane protein YckC